MAARTHSVPYFGGSILRPYSAALMARLRSSLTAGPAPALKRVPVSTFVSAPLNRPPWRTERGIIAAHSATGKYRDDRLPPS
jgi:hypothetical protein